MNLSPQDHHHMAHALILAERGRYSTDPNPRVGCVLVKDGEVIGEGWHKRAGEAHAEINALAAAGEQARGATAYVTLEPCSHHGKTPPCTDALIGAGVSRVIAAMEDPNPRVAGSGLAQLRAAGIETHAGLLQAAAAALNPGHVSRMSHGRPYVRLKLAMSLDGRTAMASGESQWITSAAARRDVHLLRARSSAILCGAGTVLQDDPSLTVRLDDAAPEGGWRQPLRVILDPDLQIPAEARMLGLEGNTLVITRTGCAALSPLTSITEVIEVAGQAGRLDLSQVMALLAEREINEVTVESGATLCGALLEAGLVDELVIYMAPILMGDAARGLFHLPAISTMAQRRPLHIRDIRAVGSDWRITAVPEAEREA